MLVLLDPHSVLEHPGNRSGAHTRAKKQDDQKVPGFASFTHLAPEFPMKGASAARRAGQEGKKKLESVTVTAGSSPSTRDLGVLCFLVSRRTGLLEKAHCTSELQHSTKFLHFYFGAKVLQEKVW